MNSKEQFIQRSIIRDMSEGVLSIGMDGKITTLNKAACRMLGVNEDAVGKSFAGVFFSLGENDDFIQAILDAVYQNTVSHNRVVGYDDNGTVRQLFISTSYLKDGDEKIGVSAVFSDITELAELRDAVKAMERIKGLNSELEKRNEFIKKTFGRYLSDDIVNTILETENGLEIGGKKQDVAIMFTDLRGFTFLSEQMNPRDLITMLNSYLEHMIIIVQKHRGTILEFIGDAIVAVFGAPLESETRCYDAVRCAVEMQCEMEQVNRENDKNGFPKLQMGIGIHCGDVVLGNIGSERKTKYDIIGKNVNLASRVETYTVGGQVFVSETVKKELGDRISTVSEQEIMPKGVKIPVKIYEVAAIDSLQVPVQDEVFTSLENPFPVEVNLVNGKDISEEAIKTNIVAISANMAKLAPCSGLDHNKNIRFFVDEKEIYAKVKQVENNTVTVYITAGTVELF